VSNNVSSEVEGGHTQEDLAEFNWQTSRMQMVALPRHYADYKYLSRHGATCCHSLLTAIITDS
jgi:hypothetical protein